MSRTLVQLLAYIIRFCTSQARLSARLQLVLERVRMPQIHRRDLAWAVWTLPLLRQDQVLGTGRTPSPQVRAFRVGRRRCQDRDDTPHSHKEAVAAYIGDCPCARFGRRHHTELSHIFESQLLGFCAEREITFLHDLNPRNLTEWRSIWQDKALAKKKKFERVVGFFWFCSRMN